MHELPYPKARSRRSRSLEKPSLGRNTKLVQQPSKLLYWIWMNLMKKPPLAMLKTNLVVAKRRRLAKEAARKKCRIHADHGVV